MKNRISIVVFLLGVLLCYSFKSIEPKAIIELQYNGDIIIHAPKEVTTDQIMNELQQWINAQTGKVIIKT